MMSPSRVKTIGARNISPIATGDIPKWKIFPWYFEYASIAERSGPGSQFALRDNISDANILTSSEATQETQFVCTVQPNFT
jgi:hypothetical protein